MKKLLLTTLLLLGILAAIGCFRYRHHIRVPNLTTQRYLARYGDTLTLQQRLDEAHKTVLSSPCMHGAGGGSTDMRPAFSNKPGSNCSSLGKFVTAGRKATGRLGQYETPSYTLQGRDGAANNNTERRGVVIHGWAENAGRHGKIPEGQ